MRALPPRSDCQVSFVIQNQMGHAGCGFPRSPWWSPWQESYILPFSAIWNLLMSSPKRKNHDFPFVSSRQSCSRNNTSHVTLTADIGDVNVGRMELYRCLSVSHMDCFLRSLHGNWASIIPVVFSLSLQNCFWGTSAFLINLLLAVALHALLSQVLCSLVFLLSRKVIYELTFISNFTTTFSHVSVSELVKLQLANDISLPSPRSLYPSQNIPCLLCAHAGS